MWVMAMQSVFEESLPRPRVDTVRGEMFPSAWVLQRSQRQGREIVTVMYLLQVTCPSSPSVFNGFFKISNAKLCFLKNAGCTVNLVSPSPGGFGNSNPASETAECSGQEASSCDRRP